jgi:predicted RNA methylase
MSATAPAELTRGLHTLGYTPEMIAYDPGDGGLDLVAYTSSLVRDMSTSAVAGWRAQNGGDRQTDGSLAAARELAAPAALASTGERMSLFRVGAHATGDQLVAEFAADDVDAVLIKYSADLGPASLATAKRSAFQLPLFPIDVRLLASTRESLVEGLHDRIQRAYDDSSKRLDAGGAVRAVIAALAVLVVRDRFHLPVEEPIAVADEAVTSMGPQFLWLSELVGRTPGMEEAVEILRTDVDFGNLDATTLSMLYEELLLSDAARKKLGIYYTPIEFARRILAAIPLEEVQPEHRSILDPSCGAGNLLVASHERLLTLAPGQWDEQKRHDMILASLRGTDVDEVAVEIARLSLLVNSLPFGNHWQVDAGDALTEDVSDTATVVVSNPPWSGSGKSHGRDAEGFLDRMMLRVSEGGFLGCVMPGSWQTAGHSSGSRSRLREDFDVFEVWRLPRDVFPSARQSTCVVFAQKRRIGRPYLFRHIAPTKRNVDGFLSSATTTYAAICDVPPSGGSPFGVSPFETWKTADALPTLGAEANIYGGQVVRSGPYPAGKVPLLPRGARVDRLGTLGKAQIVGIRSLSDAAMGNRNIGKQMVPKVLVPAQWSPDTAWRSRPVLDELAVVPNDSWHSIIPEPNSIAARHSLMALLSSGFASAWLFFHASGKRLPVKLYQRMPLPRGGLSSLIEALEGHGEQLVSSGPSSEYLRHIDSVVFDLYAVPSEPQEVIRRFLTGFVAPEGGIRYPEPAAPQPQPSADPPAHDRRSAATVLDVGPTSLRMWTDLTTDDGVEIPIPDGLPGWLCREGATFEVEVSASEGLRYRMHRMAWLAGDGLQLKDR